MVYVNEKNIEISVSSKTEEIESGSNNPPIWLFWRARRYIVTILVFFGLFCDYALRVNMSVAIVAMTQYENITLENGTTILQRDFDWDTTIQGHILSSFYYGYLFTQIIGGYLSTLFGGKPVFAVGIAGVSILNLVTPWLSRVNVYALLAVRVLEGIFEGMLFPCANEVFARWAPSLEKGRLVTIGFSGCYVGTLASLPISSMLAAYLGWESIFYAFGTFGCLWTILWLTLTANTPAEDSSISQEELLYITENREKNPKTEKLVIPWGCILTSGPVWALTVSVACKAWGFFALLSHLPQFVKYCLHYDLKDAGFVSAMPYLAMSVLLQLTGRFSDFIEAKKVITTTHVRKILVVGGLLSQCVFMVLVVHWLSIFGSNFCLIMAVGLGGLPMAVFTVNPLDLSKKYGSIVGGIAHTFGTISGILAPTLTGYIVTEETNVSQWRIVFYIASSIYFLGAISFGVFGSGEQQPWNNSSNTESDHTTEKEIRNTNPCYENKNFGSEISS